MTGHEPLLIETSDGNLSIGMGQIHGACIRLFRLLPPPLKLFHNAVIGKAFVLMPPFPADQAKK